MIMPVYIVVMAICNENEWRYQGLQWDADRYHIANYNAKFVQQVPQQVGFICIIYKKLFNII